MCEMLVHSKYVFYNVQQLTVILLFKPGLLVEDVKTRALSLRTQYSRLVKPKPGGHGNKVLTSKQKWILRAMDFIRPHIVHRPSETKVSANMFCGVQNKYTHLFSCSQRPFLCSECNTVIHYKVVR